MVINITDDILQYGTLATIDNGAIILNGVDVGQSVTIQKGDILQILLTSSIEFGDNIKSTLTIGVYKDSFDIATEPILHNGIEYRKVISPFTKKVWLDRNLGASQVCISLDDTACYGDYFQWGRAADGHEKTTRTTSPIIETTITPNDGSFILPSSDPYDWTSADQDGQLRSEEWSKTDGTSICPEGYRVPTGTEIEAETISANIGVANQVDAYNNFLKLPSTNAPDMLNGGSLDTTSSVGYIWSSSATFDYSNMFYFTNSRAYVTHAARSNGYPVRCIKD